MNRTKIVSQGMVRRLDALSQAAVDFCKVLVDGSTDRDGQELKNVLDRGVRNQIIHFAVEKLEELGFTICIPYVESRNPARLRRCTQMDCKCKQCNYQEKQDERERVFDVIEQALSMAGYQVLYGENGEVIIRNSMLEKDMTVQISELPDQRKGAINE